MEYCKWRDDGTSMMSDDEGLEADSSASTSQLHQQVNADSMDVMFKNQKQCVKNSIECKWHLAEAQQKLCSLELHNSESVEQEHAKAQADSSELRQTEQEWRRKEKMLIWGERQNPLLSNALSREVFDKSFINIKSGNKEAGEDRSKSFVQQYEEQLKHFGMLNRWDDSQRYLSDHSHLVCEETANYLILWCFHLQADKKEALMEQVAHQAMAMQFILEMANSHKVDPRGCFRQFFQKAKAGEEGYLEAFTTELEAFKWRVKQHSSGEISQEMQHQKSMNFCCLDPMKDMESSAPRGFQLQDRQILPSAQSNMNPQVAEYYIKHCIDAGLWVVPTKGAKEDIDETGMMETS
ncbi:hsp90 co-chaperone Cdc37-like 1 [Polyodon spathula]|uniref:hsp90 co-chaperone Cdc37-like 1 n=1 Tax=Polyodon spathula TaxID=7913 RepID=UPI001B7EE579|nr:hsp90 co-chaperone Cdc37-like 1 [Polyodon spathula]XP_041080499.1 hsp90 co-chaperone Cdc37-like 1 [Polyodon spathula]